MVVGGAVLATQVTGWNRIRLVSVAQSFTPLLALAGAPIVLIGCLSRKPSLTIAGLTMTVGFGTIVAPSAANVLRPKPAVPQDRVEPAATLSIAHCNLLYLTAARGRDVGATAAALLATGADVLALSELTPNLEKALVAAGAGEIYPFRFGRPAQGSEGVALWSKWPLEQTRKEFMDSRPGVVALVASAAGRIRVVLAHPDPPTSRNGLRQWGSSLERIATIGEEAGPPTIIVADLNASRWHPLFRRMLRRGWRDAHEAVGRGFSVSWPADSRLVPAFVRLDHALVRESLDVHSVRDFVVPGSDHIGFVVTVQPT